MPIPFEQFTLLYVKNIRNCMLDKQGSHLARDSTATGQIQSTTLANLIWVNAIIRMIVTLDMTSKFQS